MLNEQGVRDQLTEVRGALGKLDAERKALLAIESSLVTWLDLHSDAGASQLPLADVTPTTNGKANGKPSKQRFVTLGSVPLKDAIVRALRNREGTPMSTADILATARSMGAVTGSKEPDKVVEWILYDLVKKGKVPVRKVQPHLYEYVKAPPRPIAYPPPPPPPPQQQSGVSVTVIPPPPPGWPTQ